MNVCDRTLILIALNILIFFANIRNVKSVDCVITGFDENDWFAGYKNPDSIQDDYIGVVKTFEVSNVNAASIDSVYFNVELKDDTLTIFTTEQFKQFEENEVEEDFSFVISFDCNPQGETLKFTQHIIDNNNHEPKFSQDVYTFESVPMPIPAGFDITLFKPSIYATDIDISNRMIDFTIEDNQYLDIGVDSSDSKYKTHKAKLYGKSTIRLDGPLTLTIKATDRGNPKRSSTAKVILQVNETINEPITPKFEEVLYKGQYNTGNRNVQLDPLIISIGKADDVKISSKTVLADHFEAILSDGQVTIVENTPIPEEQLNDVSYIALIVEANKYDSQNIPYTGTAVVILDLPKVDITTTTSEPCPTIPTTTECPPCTTPDPVTCPTVPECPPCTTPDPVTCPTVPECPTEATPDPCPTVPVTTECPPCTTPDPVTCPTVPECPTETTPDPITPPVSTECPPCSTTTECPVVTCPNPATPTECPTVTCPDNPSTGSTTNGPTDPTESSSTTECEPCPTNTPSTTYGPTDPTQCPPTTEYEPCPTGSPSVTGSTTHGPTDPTQCPPVTECEPCPTTPWVTGSTSSEPTVCPPCPTSTPSVTEPTTECPVPTTEPNPICECPDGEFKFEKSLDVIEIDEEEEHETVLPMTPENVDKCTYTIVEEVPKNKQNWFYINPKTNGISARKIDREDKLIADSSFIRLTVNLKCTSEPTMTDLHDNFNNGVEMHRQAGKDEGGRGYWIIAEPIPNLITRSVLAVIIKDKNDNPPKFRADKLVVGYPNGKVSKDLYPPSLATVKATDKDIGKNAEIVYSIDNSEVFTIHPETGIIYPTKGGTKDLNKEGNIIEFSVTARNTVPGENNKILEDTLDVQVHVLSLDQISVIKVEQTEFEDPEKVVKKISEKTEYDVRILTAAFVPSDKSRRYRRDSYDSSEEDENKSILNLVTYALEDSEPVDAEEFAEAAKGLGEEGKWKIEEASRHPGSENIRNDGNGGLLAAVITLSILLALSICGAGVFYYFVLRPKMYEEFRNSVSSMTNSAQSSTRPFDDKRPTVMSVNLEGNNFIEASSDAATIESTDARRKSFVTFNDMVEEIEIERL